MKEESGRREEGEREKGLGWKDKGVKEEERGVKEERGVWEEPTRGGERRLWAAVKQVDEWGRGEGGAARRGEGGEGRGLNAGEADGKVTVVEGAGRAPAATVWDAGHQPQPPAVQARRLGEIRERRQPRVGREIAIEDNQVDLRFALCCRPEPTLQLILLHLPRRWNKVTYTAAAPPHTPLPT